MVNYYFKRSCLLLFILTCFTCKGQTPVSFYQDSFNGGVTANGWSPDIGAGETGYFSINIHPGSTIHKAYLLSGRIGPAPDIIVQLDTFNLTFNASTVVTPIFQISSYGGNSAVCAIDVTNLISDTANNYTLTVPAQGGTADIYNDFYLYVAYNNPNLPVVNTAIFLNQSNMADTMRFTPVTLTYPFLNRSQFGLSVFSGYECDQATDGEYIYFNTDSLGLTGGADTNVGSCGETIGSFYYYSDTLHGLNGHTAGLYMNGSNALSNVASLLPAGCTTTTSFSTLFAHGPPNYTQTDNNIWAIIVAYGGLCEKMTVSSDTTLCTTGAVQLSLTPNDSCYSYKWSPADGLSNDAIYNPIASPTVSTTYTVVASFICSDTQQVVVTIAPAPNKPIITQKGDTLLSSARSGNQWYVNDTIIKGATDSFLVLTGNQKGTYWVTVIDIANGCGTTSDSLVLSGIEQLTLNSEEILLYPNPTGGIINVTILSSVPDVTDWSLQLTDVLGRTLYSKPSLNYANEIDLSGLPGGVYFITVTNKTGKQVFPIIKQN